MFSREAILARISDQSILGNFGLFVLLHKGHVHGLLLAQSFACVITDVETVGMNPHKILVSIVVDC